LHERDVVDANFVFFGGSTGMGQATARELGRRGAAVLIVGREREAGETAVAQVRAAGARSAEFLQGDLSTVAGVQAVAEGVCAWRPILHGVLHSAMAAFRNKQLTADGFEFAFALQYFARAALNRLLVDALAASGDGRIVHLSGYAPGWIKPDFDDLQFERSRWGFFKAILRTNALNSLLVQEAARRWQSRPVTITGAWAQNVKTKVMLDPAMPAVMRLLVQADARAANGALLRSSRRYAPEPLALDATRAARLWEITGELAARRGLTLA
jgi:NAD(P)-dependent dehydrogenase (short-subunit alcohol dehydrogenase family)